MAVSRSSLNFVLADSSSIEKQPFLLADMQTLFRLDLDLDIDLDFGDHDGGGHNHGGHGNGGQKIGSHADGGH